MRNPNLRWPIPANLSRQLTNMEIKTVERRGKYILLQTTRGYVLLHLGMSGSLRVVSSDVAPGKHDHIDIVLDNGSCLRLRDPRRFGCVLWAGKKPLEHKLLKDLGPEPLSGEFSGEYLYQRCRGRQQSIKTFIMDSHTVVGVGNIYASESLFRSGIHPKRAATRLSLSRCSRLAEIIKQVLAEAIEQGGTTLRDFVDSDGSPGYFSQQLTVYDRAGEACRVCNKAIRKITQGQRSTFYCPACQR